MYSTNGPSYRYDGGHDGPSDRPAQSEELK